MSVITALFDQIEELVGEIEKLIAELDTAGQDQIDRALAYKAILDEMEEEAIAAIVTVGDLYQYMQDHLDL